MSRELTAEGETCGRTKAATHMKLATVKAKQKKKYKVTTDSRYKLPVAPNLLNREFTVSKQNIVYCSDITYIWTREGWLYLAVVLDLYFRKIVGWSLSSRIPKGSYQMLCRWQSGDAGLGQGSFFIWIAAVSIAVIVFRSYCAIIG